MSNKTPKASWIIFAWYALGLFTLALTRFLISSESIPLSEEQKAAFANQTIVDQILAFSGSILRFYAALLLVLRKASAVKAFLLAVILTPVLEALYVYRQGSANSGLSGWLMLGFVYAVLVLCYVYASKQKKNGMLT